MWQGTGGGDCSFVFEQGEIYLLYASYDVETKLYHTNTCTRSRPVAYAADDLDYLRGLPGSDGVTRLSGTLVRLDYSDDGGQPPGLPGGIRVIAEDPQGRRFKASTDADGFYKITGLPPGRYKVRPELPSHLSLAYGNRDEVAVPSGGCAGADFLARTDGRISGLLLDAEGKPVTGAYVDLVTSDLADRVNGRKLGRYEKTGRDGRFEFKELTPGTYLLGVNIRQEPSGDQPFPRTYYPGVSAAPQARRIKLDTGEKLSDYVLRLPPRLPVRAVEGVLVWPDGKPVTKALTIFKDSPELTGGETLGMANVDGRGHFSIPALEGQEGWVHSTVFVPVKDGLDASAAGPIKVIARAGQKPIRLVAGKKTGGVSASYPERRRRLQQHRPAGRGPLTHMPRRLTQLIFILAAAGAVPLVVGQSASAPPPSAAPRTAERETFRQLLYLPAPTPRTMPPEERNGEQTERPPGFHDDDKTPPDNAPAADLLDYWERRAGAAGRDPRKPSEAVRRRLLDACEADPERLPRLLPYLPDTQETADRVKKLYDAAQGGGRFDGEWRKSVREWLLFNSKHFLSDLTGAAKKAADKEGDVDKEEALRALARVDWEAAEPLLQSLSGGGQPRTAALALALLYRHAIAAGDAGGEDRYRARLQSIAADRAAPARARDTAIEELSLTEWSGRDEWYLSLFADESLLSPSDGSFGFSPLTTLFDRDPDRWIPVMTKLVESRDAAVRQNAASCLVQFVNDRNGPPAKRREAALPVLRWLSDPEWLRVSPTYRAWFMQHMDELDIREAVPGLSWIVEHDKWNRQWAARTLAYFKDPRAVPALKKALAEEKNEDTRQYILQGLIASGGLTETEQLAAIEAYATKLTAPGGREEVERYRSHGDEPLPQPISIGAYLARQKDAPDSLVRAMLARADALRKKNPELARALLGVAEGWQARQVDLDMLRRIGSGVADAATVSNALERRARLRESVGPELRLLLGGGGSAQGVAAVILGDEALSQSILASNGEVAQLALLACARLTQTPLPAAQVGVLLRSKDADLQLAAERYLLVEDSREARELLWARHPGEAFVTGWRENIPLIGGSDFSAMDRAEEKLRTELFRKEDAPLEVYAVLGNSERPLRVLRVYPGRAVYTHYEDDARYRERAVTGEELSRFRQFVMSNDLPDFGPQFGPCHHDCWVSEFLILRREGGRRIFSHQGFGGWMTVLANFDLLGGEGAKVHYRLEQEIKGLEVLIADENLSVKDVWLKGSDLRVLVERAETPEEAARQEGEEDDGEDGEEDEEEERAKRRREQLERARARASWRSFAGGRLGDVTSQPEDYPALNEAALDVDDEKFPSHLNARLAQAMAGKYHVLAGTLGEGGLWKKAPGQNAVRISSGEGVYANPVVTLDGLWAVAARAGTDWGRPNDVIRLNLKTGREYRVQVPPAEQFEPVAYVAARGKVLLRRARDEGSESEADGPAAPEYYLLDASTGRTELVSGVFEPLLQEGGRPLQPTGKPDEFWAAVPDRLKNETRIGRYNLRDFSFRTTLVVPHIIFDSMSMQVDEAAGKLYVVYEGQLLRLPFRSSALPEAGKSK